MEVCDGGEVSSKSTGYGQIDLNNLLKYKQSGGKRTTPQDKSEQIKSAVEKKDSKMFKCNQCDFITQNQTFFREHMTRGHVDKPRCPFCYETVDDIPFVRKHFVIQQREKFSKEKRVKRFQLLERDLVDTSEMVKESVCLPLGRVNTTTL